MRCGNCGNDNAAASRSCEMCGFSLSGGPAAAAVASATAPSPATKRRTEYDASPVSPPVAPQPVAPVSNPSQKRRTEFEQPVAAAIPASRPNNDAFGSVPPRPAFDPKDPWGPTSAQATPPVAAAVTPAPAAAGAGWGTPQAPPAPSAGWGNPPQPPAPSAWPAAPPQAASAISAKPKTIIEGVSPAAAAQIRAALFEYRSVSDAGKIHPLRAGQNKIGRSPDRDVVIEGDSKISGEHAFLTLMGDVAKFVDGCSTNGSIVDGVVVHGDSATLKSGSIIILGDVRLVFLLVPISTFGVR